MLKSFSTTVATPSKCPGRRSPSSGFATPPTVTIVCEPGGYMTSTGGRNSRSTSCGFEQRAVARLVARIAREVLVRSELRRVDEDRDDDEVARRARARRR